MRCAALALLALPVFLFGEEPVYFWQARWGAEDPWLFRQGDGVRIVPPSAGERRFFEDFTSVSGWRSIEAAWTGVGDSDIRLILSSQDGGEWGSRFPAREGKTIWTPADFQLTGHGFRFPAAPTPERILRIGWKVQGANPAILQSAVLHASRDYPLFSKSSQPPIIDPAPPVNSRSYLPLDPTPRVVLAENTIAFAELGWQRGTIAWAKAQYPGQMGIDCGTFLVRSIVPAIQNYEAAGIPVMVEMHKSQIYRRAYLSRIPGAYLTGQSGISAPDPRLPSGGVDSDTLFVDADNTASPAVVSVVEQEIALAHDLGFDDWMLIDYAWPYYGGRWGYGATELAAWREYLQGKRTLRLVAPEETWTFADYWRHYSDVPFRPESFGLASWDDFQPPVPASGSGRFDAVRTLLFDALWHFHYLSFLDAIGAFAHGKGEPFSATVNGEDPGNGTDYAMLGRLKDLDAIGVEFFGSPLGLREWYGNAVWDRKAGPAIDLIGEINAGGHGSSRYDRDTAFAFYYNVTAIALPRQCNIQYAEVLWPQEENLGPLQAGRYDHWRAGSDAFLLRHDEAASLERPPVAVIVPKAVLRSNDGRFDDRNRVDKQLHDANIPYRKFSPDNWDGSASFLFWNAGEAGKLAPWIGQGTGKTVVLCGDWTIGGTQEVPPGWAAPGNRIEVLANEGGLLTICGQAGIAPKGRPVEGWSMEFFPVKGGEAVVSWDMGLLREEEKANRFVRQPRSAPTALRGTPGAAYWVADLFAGTKSLVRADASGEIAVTLSSSPSIVYCVGKDEAMTVDRALAAYVGTVAKDRAAYLKLVGKKAER